MIWSATDLLTDQDGMCLGMEMDNSDYLLEMNNLIQTEMGRHFDEVHLLTPHRSTTDTSVGAGRCREWRASRE